MSQLCPAPPSLGGALSSLIGVTGLASKEVGGPTLTALREIILRLGVLAPETKEASETI